MNMHVLRQRSQARLIRFEEQEVPGAELADFDPLLVNRFTRSGEGDAPIQLRRLHLHSHWIRPNDEYLRLGHDAGERQGAYLELFHAAISSSDLREICECTRKGWALGNERFREQVEALRQRRATSKGVGRPRKDKNRV